MGKAAPENLRRKVRSALTAERALGDDPAIRHGHDRCWYVLAAALAANGEVADSCLRQLPHRISIGE